MSALTLPGAPPTEYLDPVDRAHPAPPPRGGLEELLAVLRRLHASEADLDGALALVVDKARELLQADLAWGGTVRDGLLRTEHLSGTRTRAFVELGETPIGMALSGVALQRQHTLIVSDYARYEYLTRPQIRDGMRHEGVVSMMVAPMFRGDQLVGYVNVANRRPTTFAAVHSSLLTTLTAQASVAMLNASLQAELRARNALLTQSLAIHRELTASALHGLGVDGLLESLGARLGRRIHLHVGPRPEPDRAGDALFRVPVLGAEDPLGWLTVEGPPLAPLEVHALHHGAAAMALELLNRRAACDAERRMRSELLEELVHVGGGAPAVAQRARRLGHDPQQPRRVIAVAALGSEPGVERIHHALHELLERQSATSAADPTAVAAPLTYHRGDRVVAALPVPGDALPACLHASLAAHGWSVAAGVSRPSADLPAARAEAFACLELALASRAATVVDAARIGPLRFLLDAPDTAAAAAHVRARLGALADAERRSSAPLLGTARAYVEADGHQQTVAARCAIHVNTLKYRLGRIEQALGRSLRDDEQRFELRLAFTLLDLLAALGLDPLGETVAAAAQAG